MPSHFLRGSWRGLPAHHPFLKEELMPKWLETLLGWLFPEPEPVLVPVPVRNRPRHTPRS